MLLTLHTGKTQQHEICGAFLRGDSPTQWLQAIDLLDIDPAALECYAVPQSIHTVSPAGMFIIFTPGRAKRPDTLLAPYRKISAKLFIPEDTELYPAITDEELQKILLYERNILHPAIGLVGFDRNDRIALESLLAWQNPVATTWTLAHPGNVSAPTLREITLKQKNFLKDLGKALDLQSLSNIPDPDAPSNRDLQGQGTQQLSSEESSAIAKAFGALMGMFGKGKADNEKSGKAERPPSLDEQRNAEIERLLKLFEEDPDEALRYAIPLNDETPHRGVADTPANRLGERSTDFNLGSLGNSTARDYWNTDERQHQRLLDFYNETARKEFGNKNFKKAAYIYATLLANFAEAARVLELGEHYYEAAILYRDHVKNPLKAAECFEMGNFLNGAIAIHQELKRHEKAGDLYARLEQFDNARHCYTKAQEQALSNGDYIEASRIAEQKLKDRNQALALLLKGWAISRQSEQCLNHYLYTTLQNEPDTAADRVNAIYKQAASEKTGMLLNILQQHQHDRNPEAFTQASRNIAFRIASELAENGNTQAIRSLKAFVPNDTLIAQDYTRFTTLRSKHATLEFSGLNLDNTIWWITAVSLHDQFLALGIRDKGLHLARGNWNGDVAYTTWNVTVSTADRFMFITDPARTNTVILLPSRALLLDKKVLEKNANFAEELVIITPPMLPDGCLGMTFNPDGTVTAVENDNYRVNLLQYTPDFSSHTTTLCTPENTIPFIMTRAGILSEVFLYNNQYFTYTGTTFFRITTAGLLQAYELGELIWLSAISPASQELRIVLVFETGFFLYRQPPGTKATLEQVNFGDTLIPTEARFIADDKFVICGKQKMITYRIIDAETVEEVRTRETKVAGRSIMKGRYRNQYALLTENGTIKLIRSQE